MSNQPPKKTIPKKRSSATRSPRGRMPLVRVRPIPQDRDCGTRPEEVGVGLRSLLSGARRVAETGNIAALYDGLMLCASWYGCGRDVSAAEPAAVARDELGVMVPRWIVRNALKYMRAELLAAGRCPTQKWATRFVRDMRFMMTLEAVETARAGGAKWTDGQVWEAVAEMDSLTPTQVEGRYKRGMRDYKQSAVHKRFYIPMYIRELESRDEKR